MNERILFLNKYYFSISEEKERNKNILYHFLYNTDYNEFYIHSYIIAVNLFTDYKNFRNDPIDVNKHGQLPKILEDYFDGKNQQFTISRKELKEIVELSDSYRLSREDNEKIIRGFLNYHKNYEEFLDILLQINNQI